MFTVHTHDDSVITCLESLLTAFSGRSDKIHSMSVRIRTHGDAAQFTVTDCDDGETHTFTIAVDGTLIGSAHDPEEVAVLSALGGEPPACVHAYQTYAAAKNIWETHLGIRDIPVRPDKNLTISTEQERDACRNCHQPDASDMFHRASAQHQAAIYRTA